MALIDTITPKAVTMTTAAKPRTAQTTIRINEDLKDQATHLCDSMGLSFNAYVNMAVRQLVNQRRIPFEVLAADATPTEQTRRAMIEAEAKALGLIADDSPTFTTAQDLLAYLDED
jgi:DNA-damage-inducible protein J